MCNSKLKSLPTLRLQVVTFRNELEQLRSALVAAANSLHLAELDSWKIVFGDCSPISLIEETVAEEFGTIARSFGGEFEYQFFAENLGHGGGHNRLHIDCKEDLTLILNPDGVLAPNAVSALVDSLGPGVGVVDARQLPMEHPKEYDTVTGETSWSSLACALTPSRLFRELGGIDHSTFHMYCDDVDYSWRVRLAGYSAKYCPRARMFHDKRIDRFGIFQASETEKYSSAEAALLLAYKYSRQDVLEKLEKVMERSGDRYQLDALAKFHQRKESRNLPEQLDSDHRVAVFEEGVYGAHRF